MYEELETRHLQALHNNHKHIRTQQLKGAHEKHKLHIQDYQIKMAPFSNELSLLADEVQFSQRFKQLGKHLYQNIFANKRHNSNDHNDNAGIDMNDQIENHEVLSPVMSPQNGEEEEVVL